MTLLIQQLIDKRSVKTKLIDADTGEIVDEHTDRLRQTGEYKPNGLFSIACRVGQRMGYDTFQRVEVTM